MEVGPLGTEFEAFRSWSLGWKGLPGVEGERLVVVVRELLEWFQWLWPVGLLWVVDAGLSLEPR